MCIIEQLYHYRRVKILKGKLKTTDRVQKVHFKDALIFVQPSRSFEASRGHAKANTIKIVLTIVCNERSTLTLNGQKIKKGNGRPRCLYLFHIKNHAKSEFHIIVRFSL